MRPGNFQDITGKKFGRLSVVRLSKPRNKRTFWLCKCDCGKEKEIEAYRLKNGFSLSCGCLRNELTKKRNSDLYTTHGMTNTRIYKIWQHMRNRCQNPKNYHYQQYGGRGISVCEHWNKFENFMSDMYSGYEKQAIIFGIKNTTIDRIDNNGNYEPSNCRWTDYKTQAKNRRYNHETMSKNGFKGAKKRWGLS